MWDRAKVLELLETNAKAVERAVLALCRDARKEMIPDAARKDVIEWHHRLPIAHFAERIEQGEVLEGNDLKRASRIVKHYLGQLSVLANISESRRILEGR